MKVNYPVIGAAFVVSIAVYAGLYFSLQQSHIIAITASITLFIATLWVSEALPIPATSLIPFFAFPMAGVITHKDAASALGSHVILLLMGAFMLSKSLERSNVHSRLALYMLRMTGSQSPRRLVLGFMLTAAILSMWISNTATTLMLLPIVLAIVPHIKQQKIVVALLLGIAYSASLGGVGTPIGTPPNIIFMSVYSEVQGHEIDFLQWMKTGVPVVIIAIPLMALWLTRGLKTMDDCHLPKVGSWQVAEKRVLIVFSIVALAWVLRPYWTDWFNMPYVGDSSIALFGVVLMFLVPNGNLDKQGKKETLLDWPTANDIPWGMLLLFAGGICIAKAFSASGLSEVMGGWLNGLSQLPVPLLVLSVCLFVTFLTEITSNTATATLLMPILATAGVAAGIDPALLMMPAAMSASCAFMLPVATAPNAIVYGTGKFSIKTMAREGVMLNIIAALVITGVTVFTF
ncbi:MULTISPECIES: SLC13 family permease [Alteromonadaceae]|uniref:SLC13 family permease n=1 Tax=Alteromonadaceae TaxID=72275 RepID=UPI001C09AF92|nr:MULTISPECIES: SLC13 family permease [Aliiglaciecola]MBU2876990.1 SLC13 family permease [Aliiglaciecola lipolytica]MDO6712315.1 SLC13 family permease [Aliiglaciecola sp. 2_MG-2023]MDO6753279.1 SLC13 family permease [Aliiglaciecola sp. 1_MG-2023]